MSHRREVGNILSAAPKPLKQSQEEPEPSDVNEILSYFVFFFSTSHLYSYSLTACPLQLMPNLVIPLYVLAYPRAEFIPFG